MWFKYLKWAVNLLMGIVLVVSILMLPSDEKIALLLMFITSIVVLIFMIEGD